MILASGQNSGLDRMRMLLHLRTDLAHTTSQFRSFPAKSVQPARSRGEERKEPMRDVERRFAFQPSIYSLDRVASSRYQVDSREMHAQSGIFPFWNSRHGSCR